jgi:hypothetical protein
MMQIKATNPFDEDAKSNKSSQRAIVQRKKLGTGQRTILYSKEVSDNDPDYLNMEIKQFVKLSEDELNQAFNHLQKTIIPLFSGSVNTLINKMDPKFIE